MKLRVQIPLLALTNKNFLASPMSINPEPFQRTDISTQPLGPVLLNWFAKISSSIRNYFEHEEIKPLDKESKYKLQS
jgi:hypothetical protein